MLLQQSHVVCKVEFECIVLNMLEGVGGVGGALPQHMICFLHVLGMVLVSGV